MNIVRAFIVCFFIALSAFGQLATQNPVDELKQQVTKVLADAKVPFTPDQDRQLALLIEEQRQASENLFGTIWDFSKGPPQGEDRDRVLAGIQWMHDEFKKKLPEYMTDSQRAAWERYQERGEPVGARIEGASESATKGKIQQIRVTNNAFNVERAGAGAGGPNGGGARTEVIERGGSGTYHGNFSSTFQSERFNARNPFARNKPPYYERTVNANISGPLLRDRLSINFTVNDNKQENVGTVKAVTLDGPFELGVTRPTLNRYYDTKTILQLADAHTLNVGFRYSTGDSKNQNVGNFTLPERASRTQTHNYQIDLHQVSLLSEKAVHELSFTWKQDHSERNPTSTATAITVTDAFSGGGAQDANLSHANTYEFSNLLYYAGEKWTVRSGVQGAYRKERSLAQDNFFGEFTFSDLDSYRKVVQCNCTLYATPLKYKVTRGDPLLIVSRLQTGLFTQNDLKLSKTFSLMLGLRYQVQTNIHDQNNIDPRIGFAYAIGNATVIRGGMGVFHSHFSDNYLLPTLRFDGKRQYEIQVDTPGWPDPFSSGTVRTIPPSSRRVADPRLVAQYYLSQQISIERSLPKNLFVTLSYDFNRGNHLIRLRDLNAPLPDTGVKPFPDEGQIIQYQSTGVASHRNLKVSMRQRFSIFNVTGSYTYYKGMNDDGIGGGTPGFPSNSYNLRQDWGNAALNPAHTFNTSINSRMPMNVYLTTSISAESGNYYNITTGKDDNKDGIINDRPAGLPRYSAVGPHYFNVSFNISKAFQLERSVAARGSNSSGPQMNVFANLNNAFNLTHLGTPSGVMTSPFFGKSFSASDPREIEVGMRFQF